MILFHEYQQLCFIRGAYLLDYIYTATMAKWASIHYHKLPNLFSVSSWSNSPSRPIITHITNGY